MKIAQVVCVYPPYKGGIGTMAYNHAISLVARGHAVTVFTPAYDGVASDEMQEGVHVVRLKPLIQYGNAGLLPQLLKYLEGFDIVHVHYPFFGGAEVVWRLKKKLKDHMKLVVTYHMDVVGGLITKPIFYFHKLFMLPHIIKSADKVIVTSNDYASHSYISKQFYRIPKVFADIPPEVNTRHFTPVAFDHIAHRHNIAQDEKVVLFVGGLDKAHYFKGVDVLIRAFEIVTRTMSKPVRLVIVGKGELQQQYEILVRAKGIEDKVVFAGGVSYNDLPAYYSLADVTVLPSLDKSEAFGIVLLESLACETPVIASHLPGVRTAFVHEREGYAVGIKNEGEIAGRIRDILSNEERAREMGRLGRERVVATNDTEVIGNSLVALYEDLLG